MTEESFPQMVEKLGGPLAVARQIVAFAGYGNQETIRTIISRKINGHTKTEPEWTALLCLLDYIKRR